MRRSASSGGRRRPAGRSGRGSRRGRYRVEVLDRTGRAGRHRAWLRRVVAYTLRDQSVRRATITVVVVDDREMAGLHRRHLRRRGPTDVLTFDLADRAGDIEADVVISVDAAIREARARGHAMGAEMARYAVHGLLHLVGYDDRTTADAAEMRRMEDRLLRSCGTFGPEVNGPTKAASASPSGRLRARRTGRGPR